MQGPLAEELPKPSADDIEDPPVDELPSPPTEELLNPPAEDMEDMQREQPDPNETGKTGKRKRTDSREKHPLLPACHNCRQKCSKKITEDQRKEIHKQFWALSYLSRRTFVHSNVKLMQTKRPRKDTKGTYERSCSRYYTLQDEHGDEKVVCKQFFLKTLGYTSDKMITVTLSSVSQGDLSPPPDKRGRHAPPHKLSEDKRSLIEDHINSFHPAISHYRREHGYRKYLPHELSIKQMFDDFKVMHPGIASIETYRKAVKSINTSFAKLGEEEGELCMTNKQHKHDNNPASCTIGVRK
uniref:uncharacterized protein n=1 Tax=Myxine glutinosa TaxID=7769 RepID=UPI00358E9926